MATAVMQPETFSSPLNNNKRKRESSEAGDGERAQRPQEMNGESRRSNDPALQLSEQLLQSFAESSEQGASEDNQRTAQAALSTHMPANNYPAPDSSFDNGSSGHYGVPFSEGNGMANSTSSQLQAAREGTLNALKPAVGTTEWHAQRKNNHKEVERRRRETINEGINEIAKIVPGCEKNKGSILQRAVSYITELTSKERSWENERATIDVAIKELSERNNKMKASAEQAWAEVTKWQQRCRDAGLEFDDYDAPVEAAKEGARKES